MLSDKDLHFHRKCQNSGHQRREQLENFKFSHSQPTYEKKSNKEDHGDVLLSVVRVVANVVVKNSDREADQDVRDQTQLSKHLIAHDTEERSL